MKIKKVLFVPVVLFALGVNLNFSGRNSDTSKDFSLTFVRHQASAQVEACVSIRYYEDKMKPCFNYRSCYDSQGKVCGEERCCEYSSTGSSCNETECI